MGEAENILGLVAKVDSVPLTLSVPKKIFPNPSSSLDCRVAKSSPIKSLPQSTEMDFKFRDLVDIDQLQALTDQLYIATGIPSAVISMDGEILTGSGGQRICTDYHRKHPEIEKACVASDIRIQDAIKSGAPYAFYRCPRGLTDGSAPVIIDGVHLANVFTGQLFTEPPTAEVEEAFRLQAREFGLDEEGYMAAFREIPVFTEAAYRSALAFLSGLANLIAQIGLRGLREIEARQIAQASKDRYDEIVERIPIGVYTYCHRPDGTSYYDYFSPQAARIIGLPLDETIPTHDVVFSKTHPEDLPGLRRLEDEVKETNGTFDWEGRLVLADGIRWVRIESNGILLPDGTLRRHGVIVDITMQKRAELELIEREARLTSVTENTPETILQVDRNKSIVFVNYLVPGLSRDQVIGSSIYNWVPADQHPVLDATFASAFERGESGEYESLGPGPNGESCVYEVRVRPVVVNGVVESAIYTATDITLKKRVEEEQRLTIRLLEILNSRSDLMDLMSEILNFMKESSGAEAVGIRLREGEDYPYYITSGFSDRFVKAESRLCAVDLDGQILRGEMGNPILECMCGNILCGRFDASKDFFTPHGSFFSNHTTSLLASTTEEDRQSRTRNRCNAEGYESVALIPLRSQGETFGLLQFNDHRIGAFSSHFIELVEHLSDDIAISLRQRKAELALFNSERRFEQLALQSRTVSWEVDQFGVFRYVSVAAEQVWGYRQDELVGEKRFPDLHPEAARDEFSRNAIEIMRRAEGFQDFISPIECRDGSVILSSTSGLPILDDTGELIGFRGASTDVTARIKTQEALRSSEERFRTLFERANDGIFILSTEGKLLSVNESLAQMHGFSIEEMQSMNLKDLDTPETSSHVQERMNRLMNGESLIFEVEHYHKDGHIFPLEVSASLIEVDGKPCIQCFHRDITERKLYETKLQETEQRLSLAQHSAGAGIWDWNVVTGEIIWTEELFRIFGLDPKEGAGFNKWRGILHPDDLERAEDRIAEAINNQTQLDSEYRIIDATGDTRWIRSLGNTQYNAQGEPLRMLGICLDTTERNRANALIQQQRVDNERVLAKLDEAQQIARIGSWDLDIQTGFVWWSDETYRIFGVARETYTPSVENNAKFYHPDDLVRFGKLVEESLATGSPLESDLRLILATGETVYCYSKAMVICDENGKPFRLSGVIMDITERKLAEAAEKARELAHQSILQTAMDGFWIVDAKTAGFLEVNDAYCRMSGYAAEELLRMSISDIEVIESPEETARHMQKVFDEGEDRFESRHRCKDGSIIDVEVSVKFPNSQDGRIVCFVRDVTDKNERERVNREALERFRTIFEGSPLGIALIDSLTGEFCQVNAEYARIIGTTPENMVGTDWMTITHPDDLQPDLDYMKSMNAGETPGYQMEKRYLMRDGNYVWVKLTVVPFQSSYMSRKLHLAMVEDISERKTAEHETAYAREISEARIRIIEHSRDHTFDEVLQKCIDECELVTGSSAAFFHTVDPDQEHLTLTTWSTNTLAKPCTAEGKGSHYPISQAGVWVDAFRDRKPVIHNDYESLVHRKGLPAGHAVVHRELVVPIIQEGLVRAILGVGNKSTEYNERDVQSVALFADVAWDRAKRKRAEDTLLESERKYRIVSDNTYDWEFWLSPTGEFNYCSPSCERVAGYAAAEFIADPTLMARILHHEDLAPFVEHLQTVKRLHQHGEQAYRIICKDGSVKWIEHICQAVFDEQGVYIGQRGSNRDITDRKVAEEVLAASEQKFRSYVENSPEGVFVTDSEGRFVEVNPAAAVQTGYTRQELVNMSIVDLLTPESVTLAIESFKKVVEVGSTEVEIQFKCKSGEIRWWQATGSRLPDGRTLALTLDITEKKRSDEILKAKDAEFRKLSSNVPDLIFQFTRRPDGSYHVPIASVGIKNIFGCSPEDVKEDFGPIASVLYPEDTERVIRDIEYSAEHLTYFTCLFRVQIPGKPIQWIYSRSAPEKLPDGSVTWYGFNTDITESKRAEEDRDRLAEQLRQAQKMESIGRLAGGVAHDFNNMLMAILGNVEMMLDSVPPDDPNYWCLKEIQKAGERSADLTKQLLGFARKQTTLPKVLDLNDHISSSQKMLRRMIGEAIEFQFTSGANLWTVRADPAQVDQVLMNLCVNARDAIGGTGEIEIRTANLTLDAEIVGDEWNTPAGDYVQLSVRDNGKGIESETIKKIFEPFFTTKGVGEGTGLGLSVVFGIVKQNGGYINVESALGMGTTFSILLPRYSGQVEDVPPSIQSVKLPRGTESILLVEDEPAVLNLAKVILERLGYSVIACSEVGMAQDIFLNRGSEISLLLTDMVMPKMSGTSLLKKLRETNSELKAVFMSGYSDDQPGLKEAMREGALFIPKPFTRQTLAETVRKALQ